ncbi:MAG: hypothetical protein ABIA63_04250, partial [bacterium]
DKIKDRVSIINIETETKTLWNGHKIKEDIIKLLDTCGFKEIAAQYWLDGMQGNILFLNKSYFNISKIAVISCKARALLGTLLISAIAPLKKTLYSCCGPKVYSRFKRFYIRHVL